jgi:uncharacterized protein YjbK
MATETIDERELKLCLPNEATAQRLGSFLGRAKCVLEQCNTYFDTREGAVASAGTMMIRVRSCDGNYTVTIKDRALLDDTLGSLSSRERNSELSRAQGESVTQKGVALTELNNPLCKTLHREVGAHLYAVGELRNTRTVYEFEDQYLIELDRCVLPNGQVDYELELELRESGHSLPDARERIDRLLTRAGITELQPSRPKYHRFLKALEDGN